MITRFSIYEVVRWYKGGKLGEPEKDNVPEYKDWIPDEDLRNFLLDHGCLDEYIRNVERQKPEYINRIKNDIKSEWLNHCFTWSDTPEGQSFWSNLNDKWQSMY